MTNTNKLDEFTTELLTTTIASQKAKREERQALMLASSPWIAQARAMQIKLQKEGSN